MTKGCGRCYDQDMVKVATRRARSRRRHEQIEMLDASGTKVRDRRGGKRAGAGRPPKGKRAGAPHKRRPSFKASQPIHVVLRVEKVFGNLRRRLSYAAVRAATIAVAKAEHPDFRIVHLSIQRTHIHLLVEAGGKRALAKGMKSFEISAAKHLNAALRWEVRRRGRVFVDRYHAEIITNRRQARHALAYVLNNWRKHHEDEGKTWNVDPFSSGCSFAGWKGFEHRLLWWKVPETYAPLIVWFPKTWLLQQGWMRYGRIDFREVPSAPRGPNRARRAARGLR